jgi:hypothetical protein
MYLKSTPWATGSYNKDRGNFVDWASKVEGEASPRKVLDYQREKMKNHSKSNPCLSVAIFTWKGKSTKDRKTKKTGPIRCNAILFVHHRFW